MSEPVIEFFYTKPSRIVTLGTAIFRTAAIPFLAALFGRVATVSINILPTLTHSAPDQKTLADIFPNFSTWWIPESLPCFFLTILVMSIGLSVAGYGKYLVRQLTRF